MTTESNLRPRQIGYLRNASPSGTPFRLATGPIKAMLNKMVTTDLVETDGKGYRRTPAGDEAIAAFDANLGREHLDLMRAIEEDDRHGIKSLGKALQRLIDSDLAWYGHRADGDLSLTRHGQEVLAVSNDRPAP